MVITVPDVLRKQGELVIGWGAAPLAIGLGQGFIDVVKGTVNALEQGDHGIVALGPTGACAVRRATRAGDGVHLPMALGIVVPGRQVAKVDTVGEQLLKPFRAAGSRGDRITGWARGRCRASESAPAPVADALGVPPGGMALAQQSLAVRAAMARWSRTATSSCAGRPNRERAVAGRRFGRYAAHLVRRDGFAGTGRAPRVPRRRSK